MTALTLRGIWKNPPVTLHEICKIFAKFQKCILYMATSTLPPNLQEAAVTICSEKFGCPLHKSLHTFKEHLLLMAAFKVYHMCREHWEGSWWGGGSFIQCMGSMGALPRKRKRGPHVQSTWGGLFKN